MRVVASSVVDVAFATVVVVAAAVVVASFAVAAVVVAAVVVEELVLDDVSETSFVDLLDSSLSVYFEDF